MTLILEHQVPVKRIEEDLQGEFLDHHNFELLFKADFLRLCLYCQRQFGFDTHLSKEIVHAGFVKLWETRGKISEQNTVRSYLHKIIHNSVLDLLRHQKVRQKYEKFCRFNLSAFTDDLDHIDLKKLEDDIYEAIARLPENMRRVFELSRYEGLKYAEIALQMNISIKTVETHMRRALAKLREQFQDYLTLLLLTISFIWSK